MHRFALAILALHAGPVSAGLAFCNETDQSALVAIGYSGVSDWTSEGWWRVEPDDCAVVIGEELTGRYYYWHAFTDSGSFAAEDFVFCVQDDAFTIQGDADCSSRGFREARFTEVDVGDAQEFTVSLTPVDAPRAPADAPRSEPQPEPAADLVTLTGRLNTCDIDLDSFSINCEIIAAGRRYVVDDGPQTDQNEFETLISLPDNAPVRVTARPLGEEEGVTRIALRSLAEGPADRFASIRSDLQGIWSDAESPGGGIEITGSRYVDTVLGTPFARGIFDIADGCDGQPGPVIIIDYGTGTDVCWEILNLTSDRLHVRHARDRSEFIYEKL